VRLVTASAVLMVLASAQESVQGQTAWYEGFEGPEASWEPAGGNVRFQIEFHQRVQDQACTGDGCEHLRISGSGGTYVYIRHPVGHPRVIEELAPSVQVKSDRAGLQMLARVVLPRSADPRTGRPLSTLVGGSSYTAVGRWQQLRIDDFPQRLAQQTRILRTQFGPAVDPREAYVEDVLLNVYGGAGVTNVWIDDLDVAGYVGPDPAVVARSGAALPAGVSSPAAPSHQPGVRPGSVSQFPGRSGRRVQLVGSVLQVDGRPTFPRMIQYRGEPLAVLGQLGFNAVWLDRPPTPEILDQAIQLGLWLVCPPPGNPPVDLSDGPPPPIGPQYDCVLAWDLGRDLSKDQLPSLKRWADQVRVADRENGRPLICRPQSELRAYSRSVDLLMIGRAPLGTSLELTDYGTWIRQRPRLARPGTPIWSTVQTQPAPSLRRQWAALGHDRSLPGAVSSEQIRLLAYTAVIAGSRGLLFESDSPLTAADPETRTRAATLELVNLELGLIEPWMAAGSFVTAVEGSDPNVIAAVLRIDRARLLVPLWSAPGAQFVAGQSAANGISWIVPGVPESNTAYRILPGGLEPLRHKRVTGGMRVTLDEFGLTSRVLLTQDPLVVNSMTQRAARIGRRAAQLQRQLAAARWETVQQVDARLRQAYARRSGGNRVDSKSEAWLDTSRKTLQWCDGFLAARDYPAAYLNAERAMRPLRLLERAHWQQATASLGSPVASPAAVNFRTLPVHWGLMARLGPSQRGENRLAGGDFEDVGTMLQAGWNHFQHPMPDIRTEADLAPQAARSGRYGLRLSARPAGDDGSQPLVETPPLWITGPAVPVEAGTLVVIHGWVQVPTVIPGSVDGLMIFDSLGGEPLARRIGQTTGWQEFTLYRVAPESGSVRVTFALSGLGEAWLDDVTIRPIPTGGPWARRPDPTPRVTRLPPP